MRRQFLLLPGEQVVKRICQAGQGRVAWFTSFFGVALCAKVRKSASKIFLEEVLDNQFAGCYFFEHRSFLPQHSL